MEKTDITLEVFYSKLRERVSTSNAKLLLHKAIVQSGLKETNLKEPMNKSDVQTICLELIKSGGPCFYVGKEIYKQIH
ncbi:MAG: hypothetical protein D6797_05860 [Bdellovibrio sp.]|nr:MAG: hypothetical protein D6797_05860 [Bdellovibrio sp.]